MAHGTPWPNAVIGPDPDANIAPVAAVAPASSVDMNQSEPESKKPSLRLASKSFGTHLSQAAQRYGEAADTTVQNSERQDLIEDVLAKRERVRRESVGEEKAKRSYSSREILA